MIRKCLPAKSHDGCESESHSGAEGTVCFCDTEKCNGAVMTSSFGHVITVVALLVCVVIGYQLL